MAGIYIHIPFCKKACHYCDFHFSTSTVYRDQMVEALKREILLQRDYLKNEEVETIYLGGGTPSVLSADETKSLIGLIYENYPVISDPEITIEANPDDLNPQKVRELKSSYVNRFSIGIQSFFEEDLRWMNRAHNASEAESAIMRVQDAGFENISADLIYGFPLLSNEKFRVNIYKLLELLIPHISSYSMTIEPRTALASFIQKGIQKPMNDAQSAGQFLILMEELEGAGFEHYEISNFSKPGQHSKHNSNYWEGVSYLGIGPSSHSYNRESRQWNIANNTKYIDAVFKGQMPFELELLSSKDKLNEYIMTSLRTSRGMDMSKISREFDSEYENQIQNASGKFLDNGWMERKNFVYTLTQQGKLYADHIASELFVEEIQ